MGGVKTCDYTRVVDVRLLICHIKKVIGLFNYNINSFKKDFVLYEQVYVLIITRFQ